MITIENDRYRIKIDYCYTESPRTSFDNLFTMVCFHNRYDLGDNGTGYKESDYDSFEELEKDIIKKENPAMILPIYMYDHSGITISTKPFSCRFDSGQIGFIFVSAAKAREEFSCKRISKNIRGKLMQNLIGEIEIYDMYLRGEVYSFTLYDKYDDCEIDSCSDFYGSDFWTNGMAENLNRDIIESLMPELVSEFGEEPKKGKRTKKDFKKMLSYI